MTANTEITELIRSELCRFLQDACAGKTGVKLDMDNPAAEVSAPLGFVTGYTAQFWAERLTDQLGRHKPSLFGVPLIDERNRREEAMWRSVYPFRHITP